VPTPENQRRIWRVLSDVSGVPVSDETIREVVAKHPELTGRDVKNLLKLASMVSAVRGGPITAGLVDFVLRFKPTVTAETR
jgi:hypothetical protein